MVRQGRNRGVTFGANMTRLSPLLLNDVTDVAVKFTDQGPLGITAIDAIHLAEQIGLHVRGPTEALIGLSKVLALGRIDDPAALAHAISDVPGVVEHGLFIGLAQMAVVGGPDGVKIVEWP